MVSPGAGLWHRHGDQVQPRSWAARLRGVLARAGQAPGPGDADRDHAKVIVGARRAGGHLAGVAPAAGWSLPRVGSSSPVRPAQSERDLRKDDRHPAPGTLDRLLIVNEHHLRQVLTEYLLHCNTARPHRALGQLAPAHAHARPPEINLAEHRIRRKQVLTAARREQVTATIVHSSPTRSERQWLKLTRTCDAASNRPVGCARFLGFGQRNNRSVAAITAPPAVRWAYVKVTSRPIESGGDVRP